MMAIYMKYSIIQSKNRIETVVVLLSFMLVMLAPCYIIIHYLQIILFHTSAVRVSALNF